jgi:DNA-binding MarR family transcriptional regulator
LSREEQRKVIADLVWQARAGQAANDAFDEAAGARLGINRTDQRCLDIVEREGRLTAGELARASGLTTGAVTAVLDRLERAGYARRVRDSTDRRRVLVEPTERTKRLVAEIYEPLGREGARELRRFSFDELRLIRDYLRLDRELKERHLERLRSESAQGWARGR